MAYPLFHAFILAALNMHCPFDEDCEDSVTMWLLQERAIQILQLLRNTMCRTARLQ